jgi:transposase
VERAKAILALADGATVTATAIQLQIDRRTARAALKRYLELRELSPEGPIESWLLDRARTGRPDTFDEFVWTDVLAMVTTDPRDHRLEETHWSSQLLARRLIEQGRVRKIHRTTISRFFAKAGIKPHRVRQWLNRPADPEFERRAANIKGLLAGASRPLTDADRKTSANGASPTPDLTSMRWMQKTKDRRALVSFDEKPGMQAKERIAPTRRLAPGRIEREEFEYARHGTMVLLALMVVQTGIVLARVLPHRTNADTARVLDRMLTYLWTHGYQGADIILDQLNTHWSVEMVGVVAKHCGLESPEVDQIATGRQRREWLERTKTRKVVLHFVPKHCSWLNPIEIWFSVLGRKVLRRGSFASTKDLTNRVNAFVAYYNKRLAHPYRFKKYQLQAAV